jgi:hypothetical protein
MKLIGMQNHYIITFTDSIARIEHSYISIISVLYYDKLMNEDYIMNGDVEVNVLCNNILCIHATCNIEL